MNHTQFLKIFLWMSLDHPVRSVSGFWIFSRFAAEVLNWLSDAEFLAGWLRLFAVLLGWSSPLSSPVCSSPSDVCSLFVPFDMTDFQYWILLSFCNACSFNSWTAALDAVWGATMSIDKGVIDMETGMWLRGCRTWDIKCMDGGRETYNAWLCVDTRTPIRLPGLGLCLQQKPTQASANQLLEREELRLRVQVIAVKIIRLWWRSCKRRLSNIKVTDEEDEVIQCNTRYRV